MAAKSEGFFTNTNLMVAGIICAIIGAALALVYINGRVAEATGKPVKIAFAKKDINVNDVCRPDSVRYVDLPERFVEEAGEKFVREDTLGYVVNKMPSRRIEAGEPLLTTEFETGGAEVLAPQPPPGMVLVTLDIDQKTQPGQEIGVDSVISLTGNFDFSPERRSDPYTLTILDKVRVVAINGDTNPSKAVRRTVRSVGVFVGEPNARLLTRLKLFQIGNFDVDILGRIRAAEARDQVSPETVKLLTDKLKLPPTFFQQ